MTLRRGVSKPTLFLVVWLSLPRQSPMGFAVPQLLSALPDQIFGPSVGQIWKGSRCQSHMAARSPSRYVAEVRAVSNPHFALSKDKTAHMTGKIAVYGNQVKALIGKYFRNLAALTFTNLENDVPLGPEVISSADRNRAIAVQSVHAAVQRAMRVPVPDFRIQASDFAC